MTMFLGLVSAVVLSGAVVVDTPPQPTPVDPPEIVCTSKAGQRIACPADTSAGVAMVKATGSATCILGKTWGYDDTGVWVSDGCDGEFVVGQALPEGAETGATKIKSPEHIPNLGFRIYEGEKGQIYMRLLSYVRYLNQKGLDATYVDAFGRTQTVKQREDVQLNKFFLPFAGWFLTPKFRYYLYVWSSNASQGDPAQVVGGGNLSYSFNRHVTVGGASPACRPCGAPRASFPTGSTSTTA